MAEGRNMDATGISAPPAYLAGGASYRHWVEALSSITRLVNQNGDRREVGDLIARICVRLIGVDRVAVMALNADSQTLYLVGAAGLTSDYIDEINGDHPLYLVNSQAEQATLAPSSRAFLSGRSVSVESIHTDPTVAPWRVIAEREGFQALYVAPLNASQKTLGVLTCYNDVAGPVSKPQRELIELIADHAALTLETYELRHRQERSIADLTAALELLSRDDALHRSLMQLVLKGASIDDILKVTSSSLGCEVTFVEQHVQDEHHVPLTVADESVGSLRAGTRLDESTRKALESAGLVIVLEHQRRISLDEIQNRHTHDLLGEILLVSPSADHRDLRERSLRAGFRLGKPHRLLVLRADVPLPGTARRIASQARDIAPASTTQVFASYKGNTTVVLIPDEPQYASFAQDLHKAANRIMGQNSCSSVVSGLCIDIADFASNYRLCGAALTIRQVGGRQGSFAYFEALGTMQFLLMGPAPELIDFSNRLLSTLVEPASRPSEALLPTLETYLALRRSTKDTATAMEVHPNTVNNRLDRIQRLTGKSLENTQHLLDLQLALLIKHVLSI